MSKSSQLFEKLKSSIGIDFILWGLSEERLRANGPICLDVVDLSRDVFGSQAFFVLRIVFFGRKADSVSSA